ncbi:MAG: VWA domain-containing protein [Acidobacteriota bacterium]
MITLNHYWPILLLLAVPLVWWASQHTRTGLSPRHLVVSTATRTAVVILLALALMRPVWHRSRTLVSVVYALDVSGSIAPAYIDSAIEWIDASSAASAASHARYLAFAATPQIVEAAEKIRSLQVSNGAADGSIDRSGTNIEAALRLALRSFDPRYLKRLVLITDGNETAGDLTRALGPLQEQGVRVFTVPAVARAEGDGWVDAIDLPDEVREDEPVVAEVVIFSRSSKEATVQLLGSGAILDSRQVTLTPGLNRIPFDVRLRATGNLTLEGRLQAAGDLLPENDVRRQSVLVGDRPKVLYVEGRPESSRYLRQALRGEGLEIVSGGAASLPEEMASLERFDAVILSDVPSASLSEKKMRALEAYVRDAGGGLLFAGGETSYGDDGYSGTPVEEILPVWFRIREKRKDLALVIVLDKSFSMVGPKIELSKEAAKAALDLLQDTQRFGLLTFDHSPYWTVPLQPAANRARIKEYISSVIASAHTNIYPALEKVFLELDNTEAEVKHVILLSDGKTYPDDYEALVRRMAEAEITVSTVAVGEEADRELLANIAEWGKGRSYYIRDAARVPQIFIQETRIASQSTLVEEPFRPVVRKRIEAFRGIDFATAPLLRGYVSTQAKETAEVLLESDVKAPLLARWRYGLGKTAAFTSDVKNHWAVDWLDWQGYGKFWAQLVRETMRRHADEGMRFSVRRQGGMAKISLDAVSDQGQYLNELHPQVQVVDPSGRTSRLPMRQVGPGTYRAEYPLATLSDSPYRFSLRPHDEQPAGNAPGRSRALFYNYPDEYRLFPPDTQLLHAISELTGGKYRPSDDEIFADYGESASVPTPLWPLLASLSLLAYVADVALRRAPKVWEQFS